MPSQAYVNLAKDFLTNYEGVVSEEENGPMLLRLSPCARHSRLEGAGLDYLNSIVECKDCLANTRSIAYNEDLYLNYPPSLGGSKVDRINTNSTPLVSIPTKLEDWS